MTKSNYNGRSKKICLTTVDCPIHGHQKTYDLCIDKVSVGLGCVKCYKKLPIIKNIIYKTNKKLSTD